MENRKTVNETVKSNKRTNNGMYALLLATAVVVGGSIYFACSADDDWEGSPEYLHTHAPMQTRAGVDVGGNGDTTYVLVYKENFSHCTATSSLYGNQGTATFTLSTQIGRKVSSSRFSVRVDLPHSFQTIGNTTYTFIDSLCPEYEYPISPQSYPYSSTIIGTVASAHYRRIRYINGEETTDTVSHNFYFSVDITNKTEWEKYY